MSVLLMCASPVVAQTTRQAGPAQVAAETHPIAQVDTRTGTARSATSQPSISRATSNQTDTGRVVLALGMVIGLIFAMRWAGKKFFPSAGVPKSGNAMKVLSRLVISPKQQLLMIQVGQRIVIVGDAGGQMSPLTEITDPEETTGLLAQLSDEKSQQSIKGFGSLFHRTEANFEAKLQTEQHSPAPDERSSETDPEIDNARGEINELADKVRLLSAQFQK